MISTYKNLKKSAKEYFSPFVYGAIDGTVTTFAVVASSYGANLNSKVVLILGFANLIGDGFSMAASAYASGLSERQQEFKAATEYKLHKLATEERVRNSLTKHFEKDYGFEGDFLNKAVTIAMTKEHSVVKHLIHDQFGYDITVVSRMDAFKNALATFVAFLSIGIVPLIPYIIGLILHTRVSQIFIASMVMTVVSFMFVGLMKGRVTSMSLWRGAIETVLLGGTAALIAFLVGDILASWLIH